jgi:hypothetical protein
VTPDTLVFLHPERPEPVFGKGHSSESYKGTGLNANARREAGHENAPHAA